jgi:hypothetical protein
MAQEIILRPVDIVKKLTSTQDPLVQKAAIKAAWDHDIEAFFIGLELCSNPTVDFRLKSVPFIDEEDDGDAGEFSFAMFHEMAIKLVGDQQSEKSRSRMIEEAAMTANITEWNLWYRPILLKSLSKVLPMNVIAEALTELTTGE